MPPLFVRTRPIVTRVVFPDDFTLESGFDSRRLREADLYLFIAGVELRDRRLHVHHCLGKHDGAVCVSLEAEVLHRLGQLCQLLNLVPAEVRYPQLRKLQVY